MLLYNKLLKDTLVPCRSICEILTRGIVNDGDVVEITSPIFSSMKYQSRDINIGKSFEVPIKLNESVEITDDNCTGTLVTTDSDVFDNLHVEL